ncbi:hypothetical protein BCR44DRAFT_1239260 [Catenaria anguillulae PL171]|uniref:Uncharacterized protein n=1 Tax=Catenaria anguillulae PL171 TaxID=765915 RepID=A0A1Y2HHD5_9FUNG|nr:hypothetical protein BCR44DRAFT_1239260 [Catenaria anguillulae PL171]
MVKLLLGDICSHRPSSSPAPRRRPHLASVRIHSSDNGGLLLGQLCLHRPSLACDIGSLSSTLGSLLEDKFTSDPTSPGWLSSTRCKLPQGTPLMAFTETAKGQARRLLRVWVQGDPWDSVHEADTSTLAGEDGDLGKVVVEWWPYWRTCAEH